MLEAKEINKHDLGWTNLWIAPFVIHHLSAALSASEIDFVHYLNTIWKIGFSLTTWLPFQHSSYVLQAKKKNLLHVVESRCVLAINFSYNNIKLDLSASNAVEVALHTGKYSNFVIHFPAFSSFYRIFNESLLFKLNSKNFTWKEFLWPNKKMSYKQIKKSTIFSVFL